MIRIVGSVFLDGCGATIVGSTGGLIWGILKLFVEILPIESPIFSDRSPIADDKSPINPDIIEPIPSSAGD